MTWPLHYDPPTKRYTSTPAPGTTALQDEILASPRWPAGSNLGIIRDRNRCGGNDPASRHCDGKAGDVGFPPGHPEGGDLANTLVEHAIELGVQGVNWAFDGSHGMRWGFGDWSWRRIVSGDQHTTHVHWEQHNDGAAGLTHAQAAAVLVEDDLPYSEGDLGRISTASALLALKSAEGHQEIRDAFNEGLAEPDSTLSDGFERVVERSISAAMANPNSRMYKAFAAMVKAAT